MARNGSGTYNRPEADYVFNTVIDETKVNNELDQIATALTDSIAKDGQTNPTANLPMNSNKHTGVAAGTARTDYADVASVQDGTYLWGGTGGGTVDVITITLSPAISAHTTGQKIAFLSSGANTGAVTLNPNGIGAKAVTKDGATALVAGDIPNAAIVVVQYDGTQYQLLNVSVSNSVTNTTNDMLDGTTDFTKLDVDNLTLDGNSITSTDTDGDLNLTPDGAGDLVLDGLKWPQADGSANHILKTDGAGQIAFVRQVPGAIVQVVNVQDGAVATGTTKIPIDDTIPQNTEGDEYMTLAITPTNASNKLKIEVVVNGSMAASVSSWAAALFQDSTADALQAAAFDPDGAAASQIGCLMFTYYMTAGTISSTTFKVRAGAETGGGTFTFNDEAGSRRFGGVGLSSITITEIQA